MTSQKKEVVGGEAVAGWWEWQMGYDAWMWVVHRCDNGGWVESRSLPSCCLNAHDPPLSTVDCAVRVAYTCLWSPLALVLLRLISRSTACLPCW